MQPASHIAEQTLRSQFFEVRNTSAELCSTLAPEDCNLQAMPETSPVKWHLAHTSWFFETFVLLEFAAGYELVSPHYAVLFNSYYNGIGQQFPRARRALLSRPSMTEVLNYREQVDAAIDRLLSDASHPQAYRIAELIELGLQHEAQHQELMLTDIKYCLFQNPLLPAFRDQPVAVAVAVAAVAVERLAFSTFNGGQVDIGALESGFSFDNERPRHTHFLAPFALANRLVTNGEYLAFVVSGGYNNPEHWLADGWYEVQQQDWQQPLYWLEQAGVWMEYTLQGLVRLDLAAPVSHLSYFEAQAYASWAGYRLPTEAEWESVAEQAASISAGNFADTDFLVPQPRADNSEAIAQLYGDCWEWTSSAYLPYPGFKVHAGTVGEYNGKFMSGQMVLRGGSCLSSAFHVRSSYRNFFFPKDRWQCTGVRLAADVE